MKRKSYNFIVLSLAALLFNSCFSDKSGLDTNKIDEIVIETPSMSSILRVEYLEDVTFNPTVTIGRTLSATDVTYKWQINQTPGSTDLVVIGTDKELKTTIKNKILSASYTLIFTARDEKHGVEYQK